MKKFVGSAALFLCLSSIPAAVAQAPAAASANAAPAVAALPADQQASHEQLVKLFEAMRIKRQIESMSNMVPSMMRQQMQSQLQAMQKEHPDMAPLSDEQKQKVTALMGDFTKKTIGLFTNDEMMNDMMIVYGHHLTRTDVDALIVFYTSPAGQHLLDLSPAIMQEYVPMVMQHIQARIEPLAKEFNQQVSEIIKAAPKAEK